MLRWVVGCVRSRACIGQGCSGESGGLDQDLQFKIRFRFISLFIHNSKVREKREC